MRSMLLMTALIVLVLGGTALADGASWLRDKPAAPVAPAMVQGERSGGENVDDAVVISALPFSDSGNTCAAVDDYDAACYAESTSPDVVYAFTPASDMTVTIDLCGSSYDTKVFVLDAGLEPIACSDDTYYAFDDPCGVYNASLEFLALDGGMLYYIVVDGWGGDCGLYELVMDETIPCAIDCPAGAMLENEPPMQDTYDQFNAGCYSDWNDPEPYILSTPGTVDAVICGENGFYHIPDGMGYDHDWWSVIVGDQGVVEVTLTAQRTTNLLQLDLASGDCSASTIIQESYNEPCGSTSMAMSGEPGQTLHFWVHTIYNEYPNGAYPYRLEIHGGTVATENRSWSDIKSLYR
jgi:hypothetical protein